MGLRVRFQFPVGLLFSDAGAVAQMDRLREWGRHQSCRGGVSRWRPDDHASWFANCGKDDGARISRPVQNVRSAVLSGGEGGLREIERAFDVVEALAGA